VYAVGGTGILTRLDAATGKADWSVDLPKEYGNKEPVFGMAGSPLVFDGKVIVRPGAKDGPRLVALDAGTGKEVWRAGTGTEGYSSPHRATLAGVEQVLLFEMEGLFGHDPETGKELWHYAWPADEAGQPVVQPLVLSGDRVVIGGARPGLGMRCVKVTKNGSGWNVEEVWQTGAVSPGFNDVVEYQGHLYGLDSGRLFCLAADSGEVRWKTGNYGKGQVLLVGNQLLVQAEAGHLVWLPLDGEGPPKGEKVAALQGKTWNHPAVAHGRVFVRNGSDLVCFGPAEAP
jgi:outer membrane protein assembly factor BamB